ncbi:MAG: hypothetical protein MZV64_23820 [Ignavibacteriales bacterium]|nr:hypothetical protein [Ignavibacteriales bacterium]
MQTRPTPARCGSGPAAAPGRSPSACGASGFGVRRRVRAAPGGFSSKLFCLLQLAHGRYQPVERHAARRTRRPTAGCGSSSAAGGPPPAADPARRWPSAEAREGATVPVLDEARPGVAQRLPVHRRHVARDGHQVAARRARAEADVLQRGARPARSKS